MEFSNNVLEVLNRYFNELSVVGYKSFAQVEKLLIMSFLDDILSDSVYIDADNYDSIMNVVSCMYGGCLLPYKKFKETLVNVNKETELSGS